MAFVSVFTIQQGFSKLLALATPHQPALPVPKCRQAWQLPPGGSQGAVAGAGSIQRSALFHPQMGGFAARVAKLATPTVAVQNRGRIPFNLRHPLSFASLSSSPKGGAKGASHRGSGGTNFYLRVILPQKGRKYNAKKNGRTPWECVRFVKIIPAAMLRWGSGLPPGWQGASRTPRQSGWRTPR